jgi:hypothetical protein
VKATPAASNGAALSHGGTESKSFHNRCRLLTDVVSSAVVVNGAAGRLLGTSTRDLQRLTIWDMTHTASQGDFDVLWKEFLRAGRQRGEYAMRYKDGTVVEVAYCSKPMCCPIGT